MSVARAELTKNYHWWALVVDEQEFRRLVEECQHAVDEKNPEGVGVEFTVTFSDGFSLETSSLDEVLAEENPRSRSINSIRIEAGTRSRGILCEIGKPVIGRARLAVSGGERQWVYVTFSRLEDRLSRMKEWHPRRMVVGWAVTILSIVILSWAFIVLNSRYPGLLSQRVSEKETGTTGIGVLALTLMFGASAAFGFLTAWLFPEPVFRIGDGAARHDTVKNVRSKLGWALLAACLLTPLVRLFSWLIW